MKSSEKKVLSVSIAAYNVEKYLNKAIESLLINEKYIKQLEIIIVNDGSTDNTKSIAEKYEEEYPEVIKVINKENGGYGSTINASIADAKGKYYKLLDGDDWYDSTNLEKLIDYLSSEETDLIVSPIYVVTGDEIYVEDNHPEITKTDCAIEEMHVINDVAFAMHELTVRTEALRETKKKIAEKCFYTDAEFAFYCILASNTISRFESPIYCYRLGVEGQSVSLEGMRKHYKDHPVVANRIIESYQEHIKDSRGTKQMLLDACVKNITHNTFEAYMLLEKPQNHKYEIIEFDKKMRRYKEAYSASNKSRLVYILRKTHFTAYRLMCRYLLSRYMKEHL